MRKTVAVVWDLEKLDDQMELLHELAGELAAVLTSFASLLLHPILFLKVTRSTRGFSEQSQFCVCLLDTMDIP